MFSRNSITLFALVTLDVMGFSSPNSCMLGYRPFTCTTCIRFTEDELVSSPNVCESPSSIFQLEDVEKDTLRRYMEAYNRPQYWTGYKLQDDGAALPGTNAPVNMSINTERCNNDSCCVAWQLEPFGLIATNCSIKLPALCITSVNYDEDTILSGSGQSNYIFVSVNEELLPASDTHNVMFGANLALNCSQNQGVHIKWYINHEEVDSTTDQVLTLIFKESGLYQCEITNTGTVSEYRFVTLCGNDGVPGDVDILTAIPYSQTELEVSWIPPLILGTSDPLLLRYHLLYTTDDELSIDSKEELVTPKVKDDNVIEMKLCHLHKGQIYVIGVVASLKLSMNITLPKLNTKVSTYGQAPAESVQDLMVKRLNEKTLLVSWKRTDISLPDGPVSRYEVEYRDAQQVLSNKVYVQPDSTSLILREVANVNDYEIRVAILVEIKREPLSYDYSPWTDWFKVNSTKSIDPTGSSGATG